MSHVAAVQSQRVPANTLLLWGLLGVAVFGLSLLFAPTGDDWSRLAFTDRTPAGFLAQASGSFVGHNGRIVGNSLSFLLVQPVWLRAAAKALTVIGLVAMMQGVTGSKSVWGALACFAGVFLIPAGMFRESYVWSAGFFNYLPPMIGVLHLAGVVGGRWSASRRVHPVGTALVCVATGFLTCLFVEHVTFAVLVIALSGLAVRLLRRQPDPAVTGWAAGAVGGTAVMFSSPGLDAVAANEDAYFSYADSLRGILLTGVANYSTITGSFVLSNAVLLVLLTGALVGSSLRGAPARRADVLVMAGSLAIAAYALISRVLTPDARVCGVDLAGCGLAALAVDLLALVALLGIIVVAGLRYVPHGVDRAVWVALLAATLLMLGPLLVVSPIGPRNVFGPTVTVVAITILTARCAVELPAGRPTVLVRTGIASLVVVGLAGHLLVHSSNFATHVERVHAMETAVERQERLVELPAFPYPSWVHDPEDEKIGNKYFIDQPRDIEVVFK